MYSDDDLEDAVRAGIVPATVAAAFRDHVASRHAAPAVDEEHFRLVTGFNDIFVAIASILLLVAIGWIGGQAGVAAGGFAVAATSWGLAEYFTRVRRMALPSILLLVSFIYGITSALFGMLATPYGEPRGLPMAAVAGVTAIAAWAHWRRFHVPITIAAGTAAVVGVLLSLVLAAVPAAEKVLLPLLFGCGLAVFAFAMWWDMSDRTRRSGRSDVAFWLHLMAAPMIAHPIFGMLGLLGEYAGPGRFALVILLYLAFGVIALAIDRRALLVSSLFYVLYAMSSLFERFGAVSLNLAFTGLVIGSALLTLSAFWHTTRAQIVRRLPERLQSMLPSTSPETGRRP